MTNGRNSPFFVHKRIIFATDFRESSRMALDYAVGFAHHYQSTIVMIHAFQLTQAALEAEMMSGKASCQRRSAIGVHRGMNHLVLGSNTERILLSSCVQTLTVGRHVLGGVDLDLRFRELLYISDFSPEAAAAAPFALFLGHDFETSVDICQLIPSSAEQNSSVRESLVAEYTERLKRILPGGEHGWSSTTFQLDTE